MASCLRLRIAENPLPEIREASMMACPMTRPAIDLHSFSQDEDIGISTYPS